MSKWCVETGWRKGVGALRLQQKVAGAYRAIRWIVVLNILANGLAILVHLVSAKRPRLRSQNTRRRRG